MVFWEGYISDELMGTFAPIVVYWIYSGMYQLLPPLDHYRLHTRKEEKQKNLVSMSSVVKGVLLQQLVQATVARVLFLAYDPSAGPNSNNRSGGERRCGDEKGGRMLAKNGGGSRHKWELHVEKEDSPREMVGILNRDFDRERAVAEGENWREKRRADANLQGS